jgi:hypothetical protein
MSIASMRAGDHDLIAAIDVQSQDLHAKAVRGRPRDRRQILRTIQDFQARKP